ncbi:MAG: nucleotide exchange factor GrpE [Candidatus Riflebacteria bacterium]|nr:nucleotide exchange factor GrpE [Candidatus Riflebacteria bacterium]
MANSGFSEISKNLLVFLKGQLLSLAEQPDAQNLAKNLNRIIATLENSIAKMEQMGLEHAANIENITALQAENESLREVNRQLEQSLFAEIAKSRPLADDAEKIKKLQETIQHLEQKSFEESSAIKRQAKALTDDLRKKLYDVEKSKNILLQKNQDLSELLKAKERDLTRAKDALMDAMQIDKSEISDMKRRLALLDSLEEENDALKKALKKAKEEEITDKTVEILKSNLLQSEAKIDYLETALENLEKDLKQKEKSLSAARQISEVSEETAEQAVITSEFLKQPKDQKRVVFTYKTTADVFEALSAVYRRLQFSKADSDLYQMAKDALISLEKNGAVVKTETIGKIFNPELHRASKAYRSDFFPDGFIFKEETPGFSISGKVVQKALVCVTKNHFDCPECAHSARNHELFCTKCGHELIAPDGTSKRNLKVYPKDKAFNSEILKNLEQLSEDTYVTALKKYLAS